MTLIICLGVAACAGPARRGPPGGGEGGPPGGMGGQMRGGMGLVAQPVSLFFAGLDADADMVVTRDEAMLGAAIAWERIGQPVGVRALDYEIWQVAAFGNTQSHPAYVAFDVNFDGVIDQDEFLDLFEREFAAIDADKNGLLERSEIVSRPSTRMQGPGGGQGRQQGRPPGGGEPPRR